jgi:hypothetical protein
LVKIYKLWQVYLLHFPKQSRYSLGSKIDTTILETAELVFLATYVSKEQKIFYLQKAAGKFDLVKFFLQVAWETKALDSKKYSILSEELAQIGKMLGGWIKQTSAPARAEERRELRTKANQ